MARKPTSRRPSKKSVAEAAARAEKRSKGEEIIDTPAPINPPIVKAAEIKAAAKVKRSRGRPTAYTPAVGKAVCKMLAMGMSVKAIGKREWMPRSTTILTWGNDPSHPFSDHYAKSRLIGFLSRAEEILDISDDGTNDYMERRDKDGASLGWMVNGEAVARSRLRVETRKWVLSKMLPKIYGDKVAMEHTGKDGGPIAHASVPQPTGEDHLDDLTKRYAIKAAPHIKASLTGTKH